MNGCDRVGLDVELVDMTENQNPIFLCNNLIITAPRGENHKSALDDLLKVRVLKCAKLFPH